MVDQLERDNEDFRLAYIDMKNAREYSSFRCKEAWMTNANLMFDWERDVNRIFRGITSGRFSDTLREHLKDKLGEEDILYILDKLERYILRNLSPTYVKGKGRDTVPSLYVLAGVALLSKPL